MFKFLKYLWALIVVPTGPYCHGHNRYGRSRVCPFWSMNKEKAHITPWGEYQEGGYCSYLKRGDWDINNDDTRIFEDMKTGEKLTAKEMPIGVGLLWDQCKECGIKDWL
jgi:hypothetical protein